MTVSECLLSPSSQCPASGALNTPASAAQSSTPASPPPPRLPCGRRVLALAVPDLLCNSFEVFKSFMSSQYRFRRAALPALTSCVLCFVAFCHLSSPIFLVILCQLLLAECSVTSGGERTLGPLNQGRGGSWAPDAFL